jgi:hypothetical protein
MVTDDWSSVDVGIMIDTFSSLSWEIFQQGFNFCIFLANSKAQKKALIYCIQIIRMLHPSQWMLVVTTIRLENRDYIQLLVIGISHIFEIDDHYTNIDRWSIISDHYLLNIFTDYNYSNREKNDIVSYKNTHNFFFTS